MRLKTLLNTDNINGAQMTQIEQIIADLFFTLCAFVHP